MASHDSTDTTPPRRDRGTAKPGRIGPYRLLSEIGRGGMGTVFAAVRDTGDFRGPVAIKLITRGRDTEATIGRFAQERRVLAGLDHPNIARFYDGGETEDGLPYFVMEHVEGTRIDQYCDSNNLSIRERLALFGKVCDAVQYAHTNLIVHRDLKPQNILVTAEGEPKLLDFGVAKILNPSLAAVDVATGIDQWLLTPEYASPEQVRAEPITTRSDVYSLGVLLYELLCGALPYDFKPRVHEEIMRIVGEYLPERPSTRLGKLRRGNDRDSLTQVAERRATGPDRLVRQISGDLDDIVMQAMHKAPDRRYASAGALGRDIGRFLGGEPVEARRPASRALYRGRKFYQRHRVALSVAAVAMLAVMGGATTTGWQWAEKQRAQAAEEAFEDLVTRILKPLLSGDLAFRVPVEQRREIFQEIVGGFDEMEREGPRMTGDTRLLRAEVLLGLADTAFSRRVPSMRDADMAFQFLDRAEEDVSAIERSHPQEAKRTRVNILRRKADVFDTVGDDERAIESYTQVIAATRSYAETLSSESKILRAERLVNSVRRGIAEIHARNCRREEASEILQSVLDSAGELRRSHPGNPALARDWSVALVSVVYDKIEAGRHDEARSPARELVSVLRRFHDRDPENPRFLHDLGWGLLALADVHVARGAQDEALAVLDEAAGYLRQGLRVTDGQDEGLRETFGLVLIELVAAKVLLERVEAASRNLDELTQLVAELRGGEPGLGELMEIRSGLHHAAAMLAAKTGDITAARDARQSALAVLSEASGEAKALRLKAEHAAELIDCLPEEAEPLRAEAVADGQAAIGTLERQGMGCLVSGRSRVALESMEDRGAASVQP